MNLAIALGDLPLPAIGLAVLSFLVTVLVVSKTSNKPKEETPEEVTPESAPVELVDGLPRGRGTIQPSGPDSAGYWTPEGGSWSSQILEEQESAQLIAKRREAERLHEEEKAAEAARLEAAQREATRLEAERLEAERLEAEQLEVERLKIERQELERLENERLENERRQEERSETNSEEPIGTAAKEIVLGGFVSPSEEATENFGQGAKELAQPVEDFERETENEVPVIPLGAGAELSFEKNIETDVLDNHTVEDNLETFEDVQLLEDDLSKVQEAGKLFDTSEKGVEILPGWSAPAPESAIVAAWPSRSEEPASPGPWIQVLDPHTESDTFETSKKVAEETNTGTQSTPVAETGPEEALTTVEEPSLGWWAKRKETKAAKRLIAQNNAQVRKQEKEELKKQKEEQKLAEVARKEAEKQQAIQERAVKEAAAQAAREQQAYEATQRKATQEAAKQAEKERLAQEAAQRKAAQEAARQAEQDRKVQEKAAKEAAKQAEKERLAQEAAEKKAELEQQKREAAERKRLAEEAEAARRLAAAEERKVAAEKQKQEADERRRQIQEQREVAAQEKARQKELAKTKRQEAAELAKIDRKRKEEERERQRVERRAAQLGIIEQAGNRHPEEERGYTWDVESGYNYAPTDPSAENHPAVRPAVGFDYRLYDLPEDLPVK